MDNLVKEYPNLDEMTEADKPTVRAVDELSLSIYKNQIFCLLGHNGAGKTTTISMLTGASLETAESGNASVFGLNMFKQRDLVNKIIGICP